MASFAAGGHFFLLALLLLSTTAFGQLLNEKDFYATKCKSLDTIVSRVVNASVLPSQGGELRMGASLLRLFFHDCFVQGCDASVLLDKDLTKGILLSEKDARPNKDSLRGFNVINDIKVEVEKACPKTVSCADILALAARAAVVALQGPTWPLRLGRLDSMTANQMAANNELPGPGSDLGTLIKKFDDKGFNVRELVTLSGAHTIGRSNCTFADPNQGKACPNGAVGTAPLDARTSEIFDNVYYGNLPNNGLLHSDQVLTSRNDVRGFVDNYKRSQLLFFSDFGSAMTKMSELGVLVAGGQVRLNCARLN